MGIEARQDPPQDQAAPRPRPRRAPGRTRSLLVLAATGAVAVAAVGLFAVPPLAAAAGAGVILLAALLPAARGARGPAPAPAEARSTAWPDTGMKLALEALDDPCILTDPGGIVRYQNEAATERLGPPRPGDPLSFRLRAPELLAAVATVGAGGTAGPVHLAERVPTERFTVARVSAIRAGRRGGRGRVDFVLVRLVDDTERVRMDRMRGDFVANASHELRTPLASLTGFIETLLGPARDDAANRERFLRIMLDQARRMARLVDDLLSLSRIEMKLHVRPHGTVDLALVAGEVADLLAPLADETGTRLEVERPPGPARIEGDRDEILQMLLNLAENGLKYGRRGGRVLVAVEASEGPGGVAGWQATVTDDGPGIAPEHLPRLTERFYRIDADDSRRQKGTGLGLAIVKHIVNRHRGRLSIRSELGSGSTFSVWFSAQPNEDRSAANGDK